MRKIPRLRLALFTVCGAVCALTGGLSAQSHRGLRYVDLATPFEMAAIESAGRLDSVRIGTVRSRVEAVLPGIYPAGPATDKRIAIALQGFPGDRPGYDRVISVFPAALSDATKRFRALFQGFVSPLPIYLYHSLGQRDGGSDYLEPGHRHVMLFGADMIAKYHSDDSLEPFMIHELFHLEHARHFADCEALWCTLWQEGLAVDATATMVPQATDHQLLLDIPGPIRAATERRWSDALCFVAAHVDDVDGAATAAALQMGGNPPDGLPDRFGYYVGVRLAQATALPITQLARLDNEAAQPVVRAALARLIKDARVTCATRLDIQAAP